MKKIIALMLCIAVIFGINIEMYAADDVEVQREYEVLSGLGLIPETFTYSADEEMTRGEFAQIVAEVLGYEENGEDVSYFVDVEKEYYASGAISYLHGMGLANGYGDYTFRPGNAITYDEAIRVLLGTMGFNNHIDFYKNSYFPEKNHLNGNEKLTQKQALWYIYEAINSYYCYITIEDGKTFNHTKTDKTVLEQWTGIKRAEGLVSSVGYESIFDNGAENRFLVGDLTLKITETGKFDCLGFYCEVYYYGDDSENSDEVLHVQKIEKRNEVIEVDTDDAVYNNGRLEYNKNGRTKTIDISQGAFIVRNSKPANQQSLSQAFNVGNGKITVNHIDALDMDVVLIEDYKSYLVDSTSDKNYEIQTKDGKSILLYEDGQSSIEDEEGNPVLLSDLEQGAFISVMQSDTAAGNVVTKIIISTGVLKGKLTSFADYEAVIDSEKYKVAKNIGVDLSQHIGSNMIFYLTFNGNIGYADTDLMGGFNFGYLCEVKDIEEFEGIEDSYCRLKIFAQDGKFYDYYAVKKIRIDNVVCHENIDEISNTPRSKNIIEALQNGVKDDNGIKTGSYYQPIRFKLKDKNYVREIDTAYWNKAGGESEYSLQAVFTSYKHNRQKNTEGHLSDGLILDSNSFENYVTLGSDTLKFKVPTEYKNNKEQYKVLSTLPEVSMWIDAYTTNPEKIHPDLVIRYMADQSTDKTYLGVIERVETVITIDDETVYKLTLTGGTDDRKEYSISSSYMPSLKNLKTKVKNQFIDYVPHVGDGIQYSINEQGEIINIVPY